MDTSGPFFVHVGSSLKRSIEDITLGHYYGILQSSLYREVVLIIEGGYTVVLHAASIM